MPRSWGIPVLAVLALGFTGCIYITPPEFEAKKNSLDEDDDGVTKGGGDCNDQDGRRFPGNPEVPYDGIDQDCDELHEDLLDADKDGYPGITREDYEKLGDDIEPWPTGIKDEDEDGNPVFDCDDTRDDVFPGAQDTWYDGVDSDCIGNDDYDQDDDGFIPDAYDSQSELPTGDCDDTKNTVGPHITTDDWYDGTDSDCARNNDFDADGDTFMPDQVDGVSDIAKAYKDYIDSYDYDYNVFYGLPKDTPAQWGDCVDQDDLSSTPQMIASTIYPGAADEWYDGIDSNCDTINDYDQDADSYIRTADIGAYQTWLSYWGYTNDTAGANDCDDADYAVHPATIEALGDSVDQDCDGGKETTPWSDGSYDWNEVRPVSVGRNDLHYILTTAADATSATSYTKPGVSLVFPTDSGFDQTPDAVVVWQNNSSTAYPLGETIDMVTDGTDFYVGSQYYLESSTSKVIYLIEKWVQWSSTSGSYGSKLAYNQLNVANTGEQFYNDVDIQKDDSTGYWWGIGCGDQSVNVMQASTKSGTWKKDEMACDADSTTCAQYTGMSGDTCWLEIGAGAVQAVVCDGSDCTTYDVDTDPYVETLTPAASQPYNGLTWTSVNRSGDWLVAVQSDGAVYLTDGSTSYTAFTDNAYEATYADVAEDASGNVFISAVVADEDGDGFEDVLLAYGSPSSGLSYVVLPMTDEVGDTWHAEYASVHVDEDRVLIGATGYYDGSCSSSTGNCDEVAWIFFTPP